MTYISHLLHIFLQPIFYLSFLWFFFFKIPPLHLSIFSIIIRNLFLLFICEKVIASSLIADFLYSIGVDTNLISKPASTVPARFDFASSEGLLSEQLDFVICGSLNVHYLKITCSILILNHFNQLLINGLGVCRFILAI